MATDDFDPHLPISQPRPNHIDVGAVIARARRRRRPGRIGVGLVTALAVVGLFAGGIFGLSRLIGVSTGASTSAESGGSVAAPNVAHAPSSTPAPTDSLPATCGRATPAITPADGLVATVTAKQSADHTITAIITLTNTGPKAIHGSAAAPSVVLARNGVVVWHSSPNNVPGPDILVNLAPGASQELEMEFVATICGVGDDPDGALRTDLPAAPPGEYQLYGEVQLYLDNSPETETVTVTGPAKTVTLH